MSLCTARNPGSPQSSRIKAPSKGFEERHVRGWAVSAARISDRSLEIVEPPEQALVSI